MGALDGKVAVVTGSTSGSGRGIAGHFVGHGLIGAGAGCAIGHHEAYRRDQERGRSDRGWDHNQGNSNGYASSLERGSGYRR